MSDAIIKSEERIEEKDIVIVSSKFAAMSEGRFVDLRTVKPTQAATSLAKKYELDPALAELILEESETILGGIKGFALAISRGVLAPNAGIDKSNVPPGFAILYPKDPKRTADELRDSLLRSSEGRIHQVGVILSDSRITPTRLGTIGIAVAASGLRAVEDFRGHEDLFGNELKVTVKAVADEISSAAQLVMGEADESVPVVIVRGYANWKEGGDLLSMVIPPEQCLYIRGLSKKMRA